MSPLMQIADRDQGQRQSERTVAVDFIVAAGVIGEGVDLIGQRGEFRVRTQVGRSLLGLEFADADLARAEGRICRSEFPLRLLPGQRLLPEEAASQAGRDPDPTAGTPKPSPSCRISTI